MPRTIYLSSTYEDLKEHRLAAAKILRDCGFDVDAMEKYGARDEVPLDACIDDVKKCDVFVGIIAWKYGFIPQQGNVEGRSITELEYRAAGDAVKPRLMFLLGDDAAWPTRFRDAEQEGNDGLRIRAFRKELKADKWTAFFDSPSDLAAKVLSSVVQNQSTHRVRRMTDLEAINSAADFGPSYLGNIQEKIAKLAASPFGSIRLGPPGWWTTRLHLIAALASDFTEMRQLLLLDENADVLSIAAPVEFRRALTRRYPKLERAYLESREWMGYGPEMGEVQRITSVYSSMIQQVFDRPESDVKESVTPTLVRELGIRLAGEVMELGEGDTPPSTAAIVARRAPYVVLMRKGTLDGVVDRLELASRLAAYNLTL